MTIDPNKLIDEPLMISTKEFHELMEMSQSMLAFHARFPNHMTGLALAPEKIVLVAEALREGAMVLRGKA